jgi:translation initiation factor 4B
LPFRPVDVSVKDKEVTERIEKDREAVASKVQQHTMTRTSSKGGFERTASKPGTSRAGSTANVRPAVSFASALSNKSTPEGADSPSAATGDDVIAVTEKLSETAV